MNLYLKVLRHEISKQRMLLLFYPLLISAALFILAMFSLYQTVHAYNFSNESLLTFANYQGVFPILSDTTIVTTEFNQWFGLQDRIEFLFLFFTGVFFIVGGLIIQELSNKSVIFYSLLPINPYANILNKLVIGLIFYPAIIILNYLVIKIAVLLALNALFTDSYTLEFWQSLWSLLIQQFHIIWITILYTFTLSPIILLIFCGLINYKSLWTVVTVFSILLLTILERTVLKTEFLWEFGFYAFLKPLYHLWLEVNVQPFEAIKGIYQHVHTYVGFMISMALVVAIQKSLRSKMFELG